MRLKLYISGDTQQLQQLDAEGNITRVKPATRDEAWLIRDNERLREELLRVNDENNLLAARVQELEAMQGVHAPEQPGEFDSPTDPQWRG